LSRHDLAKSSLFDWRPQHNFFRSGRFH
jgi:hypothetical protein